MSLNEISLKSKNNEVAPVQPEYKYKVVRTHEDRYPNAMRQLQELFDAGYEFVRASEFVPSDRVDYSGYIEYIVRKKRE